MIAMVIVQRAGNIMRGIPTLLAGIRLIVIATVRTSTANTQTTIDMEPMNIVTIVQTGITMEVATGHPRTTAVGFAAILDIIA
jgi:hypothetical protein